MSNSSNACRRVSRGAWLALLLTLLAIRTVEAQEGQETEVVVEGAEASWLSLPWSSDASPLPPDTALRIDIEERFVAFQHEFAREFGSKVQDEGGSRGEELGARLKKRFSDRFEGSGIFRWYQGGVRLYERFERLHERLEASTRWATSGFAVDTEMESLIDGRVKLHLERRIHGFKVGFDVNDATEGRFGLRVGGVVRGYSINLDLGDVATGQLRLGLKKRLE